MRTLTMAMALGAMMIATSSAVALHNHLAKSTPEADQELTASPKTIRLWFTEKVDPKFSSITLMKADSTKIETPKAAATDDPKSITTEVPTTLPPGKYLIRWRTAGSDGHAVRGTFSFMVK